MLHNTAEFSSESVNGSEKPIMFEAPPNEPFLGFNAAGITFLRSPQLECVTWEELLSPYRFCALVSWYIAQPWYNAEDLRYLIFLRNEQKEFVLSPAATRLLDILQKSSEYSLTNSALRMLSGFSVSACQEQYMFALYELEAKGLITKHQGPNSCEKRERGRPAVKYKLTKKAIELESTLEPTLEPNYV